MSEESRPEFDQLVVRFLEYLRVTAFASRTIDTYRSHLDVFLAYLRAEAVVERLEDITPEVLFRYQTYLYGWTGRRGRGLSIVTQSARLSAVRSLFRHLVRTDVLRYDPASALTVTEHSYAATEEHFITGHSSWRAVSIV